MFTDRIRICTLEEFGAATQNIQVKIINLEEIDPKNQPGILSIHYRIIPCITRDLKTYAAKALVRGLAQKAYKTTMLYS